MANVKYTYMYNLFVWIELQTPLTIFDNPADSMVYCGYGNFENLLLNQNFKSEFILLFKAINVKISAIVDILTFMSRINFMLNRACKQTHSIESSLLLDGIWCHYFH